MTDFPMQTNPTHVVNLSGRIMIKEFYKCNYYCCTPRMSYRLKELSSTFTPDDEEAFTIPTNVKIEPPDDEVPYSDSGVYN